MTGRDLFVFLNDLNLNEDSEVLENMEINIRLSSKDNDESMCDGFYLSEDKKTMVFY